MPIVLSLRNPGAEEQTLEQFYRSLWVLSWEWAEGAQVEQEDHPGGHCKTQPGDAIPHPVSLPAHHTNASANTDHFPVLC